MKTEKLIEKIKELGGYFEPPCALGDYKVTHLAGSANFDNEDVAKRFQHYSRVNGNFASEVIKGIKYFVVFMSDSYPIKIEYSIIISDDGFWNNDIGWVYDKESADLYSFTEYFNLPVGKNVRWIEYHNAPDRIADEY